MNRCIEQKLAQEWRQHCHALGATHTATEYWQHYLMHEYQRQGRFYHTLEHIHQMLTLAKAHQQYFKRWPNVIFAIWFHDAVQGHSSNNELKSARLAQQALTHLGAPIPMSQHIYEMILASQTHDAPQDNDSALFIDCDLSILGSAATDYQRYSQQCRKEYRVPDCIYQIGRKRFLHSLLTKERIYHTPLLRHQLEQKARRNITNELISLGVAA